ncbi:MAG: M56 family metallopeptidase [Pirellulaceae bacterium]
MRLFIHSQPKVLISDEMRRAFRDRLIQTGHRLARAATQLPQEQQKSSWRTELAHISRRDLVVGWFEVVLSVVWWFHPMLWMLRKKLQQTREDCCDDLLLARRFAP